MVKHLNTPLTEEDVMELSAGDMVYLSGSILIARDAAHKRLVESISSGEKEPFPIKDEIIFYAGPAPTPPGEVIGPIGPTTSGRMDPYTPFLLERGLRGMIGKGKRSDEVLEAINKYHAVYFGATGGTAVLLARSVVSVEKVAYEELGPEAVLRLKIRDMPLVVLADCRGGNIYISGPEEAVKLIHNNSV
ncbi:MAG: Fe-S-containing hydro-lyase [Synergistaceae bacterium]|nr:Fe-S-containing hydro-lyase [Synergistaceae bacterium]